MALFLQYILIPLLVLLLAIPAAIIKKKNATLNNRTLIVFVLVAGILMALPGMFGFTGTSFTPWFYLLVQAIYILWGALFVPVYIYYFQKSVEKYKLLFQILIMVVCMLLGAYLFAILFNFCSDVSNGYTAATTILVFPLPLIFYWTYIAILEIPFEIYKVWHYPTGKGRTSIDGMDFHKLMVLQLECSRNFNDRDRLKVKVKAPAEMVFGEWYKMFIEDYNEKFPVNLIAYQNDDQKPYGWIFYSKRSLFHRRRYIDFDKSIVENNILENVVIVAKRVVEHNAEQFNINSRVQKLQQV